jgi:hypothetical protein
MNHLPIFDFDFSVTLPSLRLRTLTIEVSVLSDSVIHAKGKKLYEYFVGVLGIFPPKKKKALFVVVN